MRDVSFEISIGNVGHSGVIFIDFLDYVASDVNFTPDNLFDLRMRVFASFSSDVDFVITFLNYDSDTDEISVSDRPYAFVLLIVDFEDIFLFIQDFHLNNLTVHFSEGLLFFQELNNFGDGVGRNGDSLGGDSFVDG